MNLIVGALVANSIIKKSIEDKHLITPVILYNLVFLVYCDYYIHYNKMLFNEQFIKTDQGLILPSLYYKFNCYGKDVIKTFSKNAKQEVFYIKSKEFNKSLNNIWYNYKDVEESRLISISKDIAKKFEGNKKVLKKTNCSD